MFDGGIVRERVVPSRVRGAGDGAWEDYEVVLSGLSSCL